MDISSSQKIIRIGLGFFAVIIVLLILIGGYSGLDGVMKWFQPSAQTLQNPEGTLLLSLGVGVTSTSTSIRIAPLIVDVANNRMGYVPFDQLDLGPTITLQHSLSGDSRFATFLGAPITSNVDSGFIVYRVDLEGSAGYDETLNAFQSAVPVALTSDDDYYREGPVISSGEIILYASLDKKTYSAVSGNVQNVPAEKWTIYIIDNKGDKVRITTGLRPKWVSDSLFAYFKDDGIYLYDIESRTEVLVWQHDTALSLVNGFDVSNDGTLIALTDPAQGMMTIIRALNWQSGILSRVIDVPVVATNPVFSPNNTYLASVVLRPNAIEGGKSVPRIEYFSLSTHTFLDTVFPFEPNETKALHLTDWI